MNIIENHDFGYQGGSRRPQGRPRELQETKNLDFPLFFNGKRRIWGPLGVPGGGRRGEFQTGSKVLE